MSKEVINQITFISDFDAYIKLLFGGDQLTSERSRKCQESRVTSDCREDALLGLQPFAADWHAEANNLEVSMYIIIHYRYLPHFENTFYISIRHISF